MGSGLASFLGLEFCAGQDPICHTLLMLNWGVKATRLDLVPIKVGMVVREGRGPQN